VIVVRFRKGDRVLSWPHEEFPGVVWRVPNEVFPSLGDYDEFVVMPFERCFRVRGGRLVEVPAGTHRVEDEDRGPGGAIYWCLVEKVWEVPFAVPRIRGLYTRDGVRIGFHGGVEFKITDPLSFLGSLVAERRAYSGDELKDWISERVVSASVELVRQYDAEELHRREMGKAHINAVITSSIFDELEMYGVEFLKIRIDGIVPPLEDILRWKETREEYEEARSEESEVRRKIEQLDQSYAEGRVGAEEYRVLSGKYEKELEETKRRVEDLKFRLDALEKKIR